MDALDDILKSVQISGTFFVSGRFTAPWCYQSPCARIAAPFLEPKAENVIIFHLITEGECVVEMSGQEPFVAKEGEVVIFPKGNAHRMASSVGISPARSSNLARLLAHKPCRLAYGGGGARTKLVCGYLACDAGLARLLLSGLPPAVRLDMRATPAGTWLESSINYALSEARSPRAGGSSVMSRLAEVLFIEILRQYAFTSTGGIGWLAGLSDRTVGKALNALHGNPSRDWTLEEIARSIGSSRTVLAGRFQKIMGTSPMLYLTQWRMLIAANMLRRSTASLTSIAEEVGYQNDTSFSRAFRREYGVPPAAWRRSMTARQQSAA